MTEHDLHYTLSRIAESSSFIVLYGSYIDNPAEYRDIDLLVEDSPGSRRAIKEFSHIIRAKYLKPHQLADFLQGTTYGWSIVLRSKLVHDTVNLQSIFDNILLTLRRNQLLCSRVLLREQLSEATRQDIVHGSTYYARKRQWGGKRQKMRERCVEALETAQYSKAQTALRANFKHRALIAGPIRIKTPVADYPSYANTIYGPVLIQSAIDHQNPRDIDALLTYLIRHDPSNLTSTTACLLVQHTKNPTLHRRLSRLYPEIKYLNINPHAISPIGKQNDKKSSRNNY